MRKYITLTVLLVAAATVHAEITPYVSLSGGLSFLLDSEVTSSGVQAADVTYDEGYILEMAAGAKFGRDIHQYRIRTELALSYQNNEVDEVTDYQTSTTTSEDGTVTATALMLNGYLDIPTRSGITPYAMIGLGAAAVDLDVDRDEVFAGQVGCGLAYALTETLILDLKYKYFQTEKVDLLGVANATASGHHVQAGLRIEF